MRPAASSPTVENRRLRSSWGVERKRDITSVKAALSNVCGGGRSWLRVICGVGMAAGILSGREFHDFDTGAVGIVDIEAPLAVAPNFRAVQFFQAALVQLACGGLNFVHAQREMILHTALLGVALARNVENVLDPVGAVGDLNFPPVVAGVLETTMPVHAEAEQIPVETIFGRAVLDDEASVQQARAELSGGGFGPSERMKLHEGDLITLGVAQREIRDRVDVPGGVTNRDVMGKEVGAHPAKIGGGKRDFEKKVWGWSSRCFRQ